MCERADLNLEPELIYAGCKGACSCRQYNGASVHTPDTENKDQSKAEELLDKLQPNRAFYELVFQHNLPLPFSIRKFATDPYYDDFMSPTERRNVAWQHARDENYRAFWKKQRFERKLLKRERKMAQGKP